MCGQHKTGFAAECLALELIPSTAKRNEGKSKDTAVKVDSNTGLIEILLMEIQKPYLVYAISLANKFKCKAFCSETRFMLATHR